MQLSEFFQAASKELGTVPDNASFNRQKSWTSLDALCPASPAIDQFIKTEFKVAFGRCGSKVPLFDCVSLFGVLQRDPPWGPESQRRLFIMAGGCVEEFQFISQNTPSLEVHHFDLGVNKEGHPPLKQLNQETIHTLNLGQPSAAERLGLSPAAIASLIIRESGSIAYIEQTLNLLEAGFNSATNLFVLDTKGVIDAVANLLQERNPDTKTQTSSLSHTGLHMLFSENAFHLAKWPTALHVSAPWKLSTKDKTASDRLMAQVRLFEEEEKASLKCLGTKVFPKTDHYIPIRPRTEWQNSTPCIIDGATIPPDFGETLNTTRFTLSELGLLLLNKAKVEGTGLILDQENRLSSISTQTPLHKGEASSWGRLHSLNPEQEVSVSFIDQRFLQPTETAGQFSLSSDLGQPKRIKGPALFAGALYAHVYSHWIIDVVSRLWCLPLLQSQGLDDLTLIVSGPLNQKQIELLELAGIKREKIVPLRGGEWIEVEQLIAPTRPSRMYDFIAPEAVEFLNILADRAIQAANIRVESPHRHLYAGRETRAARRPFLNEPDVHRLFVHRGYETIDFARLSLAEEFKLFRECRTLAGPHGSALAGCLFMNQGTDMICLLPEDLSRVIAHSYSMTTQRGVRLTNIMGENFSARPDIAPWVIDTVRVKYNLDHVHGDHERNPS